MILFLAENQLIICIFYMTNYAAKDHGRDVCDGTNDRGHDAVSMTLEHAKFSRDIRS